MALASGQPVGDLLELLGVSRSWPEVFDEMVDMLELVSNGSPFGGEVEREARLTRLASAAKRR